MVVEDHPRGFPQLAALLKEEENFCIYRGFDWLRHRLLLAKQIEIARLEEKLIDKDVELAALDYTKLMETKPSQTLDEQADHNRLLQTVKENLGEYGWF